MTIKTNCSKLFSGIIANITISTVIDGTCRNDLSELIESEYYDDISKIGNMSSGDPLMFEDISKISFYEPPTTAFRGETGFIIYCTFLAPIESLNLHLFSSECIFFSSIVSSFSLTNTMIKAMIKLERLEL